MTAKSRVAIVRVNEYDPDVVLKSMRACLDMIGGMGAFVKAGQKVLLKPNLLAAFPPERAVTTHPAIVRAAAILALEQGATVKIGDSPGFGDLSAVMRRAGLAEMLLPLGVEMADFANTSEFEAPANIVGKKIALARAVSEADVIITLPKLKTHAQMGYTGAIKNQYGLVVGTQKAHYHYRLKTREWLAALMIDINRIAKPALAIMDGITGMEGMGPAGGEPRQIGALIASTDLSAMDVIACSIIGISPEQYPLLIAARNAGFGTTLLDEIEQLGEPWKNFYIPDYRKVPELSNILRILPLPKPVLDWIREVWTLRPRIIADRCIKCLACFKGCPLNPPAIDPRKPIAESVDDSRCIRCYCCHEFCPEKAIELKRKWFG